MTLPHTFQSRRHRARLCVQHRTPRFLCFRRCYLHPEPPSEGAPDEAHKIAVIAWTEATILEEPAEISDRTDSWASAVGR